MIEEDSGDKAIRLLQKLAFKLERKVEKRSSGKKNSHIHILIETEVVDELKEETKSRGISLSELCRQKLKNNSQLDRIEEKIDKLSD